MDNQTTPEPSTVTPSAEAPVTEPQSDSVTKFFGAIRNLFPVEKLKSEIRATPDGVFVHKDFLPQFVEGYQVWLQTITEGEVDKSEAKCLKRLFQTITPPLYYVIEQKRALIGHLIPGQITQPQALGLPTYLGALEDGRRTLHVRDPFLQLMPHVVVKQLQGVMWFEFTSGKDKVRFSGELLEEFSKLAKNSRSFERELTDEEPALRDVLRVLLQSLERAHWAPPTQRLLLPVRYAKDPSVKFLALGAVVWIVDKTGTIVRCLEREGKGLFYFVRREIDGLTKGRGGYRAGTLVTARAKSPHVATCSISRVEYRILLHAVLEFVRALMREGGSNKREWVRFSIVDCLEELGEAMIFAEPIDWRKIDRHLPEKKDKSLRYLISQRWIFVVARNNGIVDVIDKFHSGKK